MVFLARSLTSNTSQDFTQLTAAEKAIHDIDATIAQGSLAASYGKIINPLISEVSESRNDRFKN